MRFSEQHPDWGAYESTSLETKEFSRDLRRAIQGLIAQFARDEEVSLAGIVNTINGAIRKEPTTNWGFNDLLSDLDDSLAAACNGRFDRAMDAIFNVAMELPYSFIQDLNETLEEHGFGYRLEQTPFHEWRWELVDASVAHVTEAVAATAVSISDICKQTSAHLEQIANNLSRDNDRALKDAVRDAMSATEALLAKVAGQSDIKDSTKVLQASGSWGPKTILRDGLSIWNHLHQDHGDIRHGNPNPTLLPREQALYWIERMMAFVNYIGRMQRNVGS